jgi:NADH-quinone oxidoreductase subunit M
MTLTLLAAMGLPSTVGFMAELQILLAGFQQWGYWMVFFSISLLITAAYAIRTISLLFTGSVKPVMQHIDDLRLPEILTASVLVVSIVVFGLAPTPLINLSASTLKHIHISNSKRLL